MGELVVLLCVLGVAALIAYPVMRSRRRRPEGQRAVTDRHPMPPRRPERPVPGSQPDRERKVR